MAFITLSVYVLSTCIPGDTQPSHPRVFISEQEAESALDELVRAEWDTVKPLDDEDQPMAYPESPNEAQWIIQDFLGEDADYGTSIVTQHTVDISLTTLLKFVAGTLTAAWSARRRRRAEKKAARNASTKRAAPETNHTMAL